jgi:hypothetical protein
MTFATEFPVFATADMPALPAGWEDISWHNDLMPRFINHDIGLGLWIDHSDPALAAWPHQGRFGLYIVDHNGDWDGMSHIIDTYDFNAVLHCIADHQNELDVQTKCVTHTDTGRGVCADCGEFI